MPISPEELKRCTLILEAIAEDTAILSQVTEEQRIRLMIAAGAVVTPDKAVVRSRLKAMRKARRDFRLQADRALRATTSIRVTRTDSVFVAPPRMLIDDTAAAPGGELQVARYCYVCKAGFSKVHPFYDSMCPPCAAFNYEKRFQTAPLENRVALITGARLKIGYQAALMMLRAGARAIVTTRFPQDAAIRYAKEADFADWCDRLDVYGLDLRHSPSVETFTRYIDRSYGRLDHLINNAAQTVRRPPGFYAHLLPVEELAWEKLSEGARKVLRQHERFKAELRGDAPAIGTDGARWLSEWHKDKHAPAPGVVNSARLSQIPYACDSAATTEHFPEGQLDSDLQQIDKRSMNSWRMTLADVPTAELLEVQLVNSIAPFILCSKLKPLMMRDRTNEKHVVNVSAMEGKFARHTKTDKHPHTNMAKAALNMMTLTSARDYVKHGIFMNAVDTGWVTDEDPAEISARKRVEHDFQPPLDIVDGAARVMDPIFSGLLTGKHSWGNFLKDYAPTAW
jgi:NAD(P)-dependent dehydrogenase (short-subunit alcohol dehydrogenase family)